MEKYSLDLSSFEKALKSLYEVIDVYNCDKTNLITRDSMIQRFEYTYSISLRMIKRYFSAYSSLSENVDGMTFNAMIRQANKMGLLGSNLEKWDDFRQKRNMTSHTYNEEAAQAVVAVIEDFANEAKSLLTNLKEKIG